jgi:transcriptional regulator of acetoin/glycerol metabolism
MSRSTVTFGPESPRSANRAPEWALLVALECERLAAAPSRLALAGLTQVEIGRGDARAVSRSGARARLDLPDRWGSQLHARLVGDGDSWAIEDAGSKNGTQVNGARIDRAVLSDGDVIECGGTFLVLRRAAGPIRDLAAPVGPIEFLRTVSPGFERELTVLPKIARSRVPVLVRGESGTGKEVVATAIHALSGRVSPLIAVNCGAIPATLVESELFGSRRGAFSGAEDRAGLVRSAERGTLFLDEVAELPLSSQVALLRVLQEGEVQPLGASKAVAVDVRMVAATHQPLEQLVEEGRFRRDLYARLRGYELRLPPLRARLEDLGLLVDALLRRIEPDGPPRRLSRAAARALFAHGWPLHVRELEQALRAATAIAGGPEIGASDLRLSDLALPQAAADTSDERERLIATLVQHGGNLSAVARALVTSRSQVHRLMERYAIDCAEYKRR